MDACEGEGKRGRDGVMNEDIKGEWCENGGGYQVYR